MKRKCMACGVRPATIYDECGEGLMYCNRCNDRCGVGIKPGIDVICMISDYYSGHVTRMVDDLAVVETRTGEAWIPQVELIRKQRAAKR